MFAILILFLVPIIISGITWIVFNHRVTWWELLAPTLVSIVLIFIGNSITEKVLISDEEYVNGFIYKVEYYEDWNEYIRKRCSKQNCSGSGKRRHCTTTYYDCSYVQYHPERFVAYTTLGTTISITKTDYKRLVQKFGNERFEDLHRNYHTNDGDMYYAIWRKEKATAEPMTMTHSYENRVQASHSVFNYPDITEEEAKTYGLVDYPAFVNNYQQNFVIGVNDENVQREFRYTNSYFGAKKQITVWVIVVKQKGREFGLMQEAYWDGSNKNEAVAVVNLDRKGNVDWVHVFSWTEREDFKVKMRHAFEVDKPLNLLEANTRINEDISKNWVRKNFSDFDYLQVDLPMGYIIFMYIFVIGGNIALAYWIVNNEH